MMNFFLWLTKFFTKHYPVVQIIHTINWHDENKKPIKSESMQILLMENIFGFRTYRYFEPEICARNHVGNRFSAGYHMWKNTNLKTSEVNWDKFFPQCEIVLLEPQKKQEPVAQVKKVAKTPEIKTEDKPEQNEKTLVSEMRF